MPHFFHPWRRKLGVVTLVMACVFMAGWVRSQVVTDDVLVVVITSHVRLVSSRGGLAYECYFCLSGEELSALRPDRVWSSFPITRDSDTRFEDTEDVYPSKPNAKPMTIVEHMGESFYSTNRSWMIDSFGFAFYLEGNHIIHVIPYWSIVLPLTLISAYLLLSKPRPKKPPESNRLHPDTP